MRSIIASITAMLIVLAASAVTPAAASTVNYQITFAAGSFDPAPTAPNPNIVLGQFQIALDTSVSTSDQTSGLSLNFVNATSNSPLSYTYIKGLDRLVVGGLANGALSVSSLTTDFLISIDGLAHGTPIFAGFAYADGHTLFDAGTGTVHVATVAPTPLPASLPLMISALSGLGLVGWRRRKSA